MRSILKTLGLSFGVGMLVVSPLVALPQYCSNAAPGCAGSCHGDENLALCPDTKGLNQTPELLKGFMGLEGLKK